MCQKRTGILLGGILFLLAGQKKEDDLWTDAYNKIWEKNLKGLNGYFWDAV